MAQTVRRDPARKRRPNATKARPAKKGQQRRAERAVAPRWQPPEFDEINQRAERSQKTLQIESGDQRAGDDDSEALGALGSARGAASPFQGLAGDFPVQFAL